MLHKRTATVNKIDVTGITFSAIFNIGDTNVYRPRSKGIAVQKEGAVYTPNTEVFFEDYSLFKQKANWPDRTASVQKQTFHHCETIELGHVDVLGVSQSSILHVGNLSEINAEARLKHFRQYLPNTSNERES